MKDIYISPYGEFVLPFDVRRRMLDNPGYADEWCRWQWEKARYKLGGA